MEIGTLSPDGFYSWDGTKWTAVELTKTSPDGFWIWNGFEWVPNPASEQPSPVEVDGLHPSAMQGFEQPSEHLSNPNGPNYIQQQPVLYAVQTPSKGASPVFLAVVIGGVFLFLAVVFTVVLSGFLYVWASDLAEGNSTSVSGTWYNPEDTMTLYPNGTMTESSGLLTNWSILDGDLITTFTIDDQSANITWKYAVKEDLGGDSVLFLALYEWNDTGMTNQVNSTSCIAYSESVLGSEADHFETRMAIFPSWCDAVSTDPENS